MWRHRPATVVEAIERKWKAIIGTVDSESGCADGRPLSWTNLGKATELVVVAPDDVCFSTDDLISAILQRHRTGSPQCVPNGRSFDPVSSSVPLPQFVDLGTANGNLLIHAHVAHGVPFSQLVGVSAINERRAEETEAPTLPDSSYRVGLNIDTLGETLEREPATLPRAHWVWSSCTFYHLVDPVGAIQQVYTLLAEPTKGSLSPSVALLTHVPLAACCVDGLSVTSLNNFWRGHGVKAAVAQMALNPDCCAVLLMRFHGDPDTMPMPFEYTGDVRRTVEGTDSCYMYATVRWSHSTLDEAGSGDECLVGLMEHHLNVRTHPLADRMKAQTHTKQRTCAQQ